MAKVCAVCGVTYSDALSFCPADGSTLRGADTREDRVGSVIADRYMVTEVLGEGGMGTVYLARHVRLPQLSAIKMLRKEMVEDREAVARFNREAANASRIDHDRVARVYDFGETAEGSVYLAMEYIPGKTLKALLDDGPLEPSRASALVRQIAEGLDAAHRMEIVHRDLKPENVMVIQDGDGGERVKIVDFGIAKAIGAQASTTMLTRTGFVVGTPEFMSPEQLLGGELDARSDIYALALVAYQCLTGDLPFASSGSDFGMAARLVTPPRPLLVVRPSVRWPTTVQAVFDQALSRDPADRPSSAGAFARALASAIDTWGAPGGAAPHLVTPTVPALAQPAPFAGGGTAARPATTVAPVVGAYVPPAPAVAQTETGAVARSARARRTPALVAGVVVALAAAGATYTMTNRGGAAAAARGDTTAQSAAAPNATPGAGAAPGTNVATPGPAARTSALSAPDADPRPAGMPTPNASAPAPNASAPAAAIPSSSAQRVLDSLAATYDPRSVADDAMVESAARRAIGAIGALMPRLASAEDSSVAELRVAEAHILLGETTPACAALGRIRAGPDWVRNRAASYVREVACAGR